MRNINKSLLVIFSLSLAVYELVPYISALGESYYVTEIISSNGTTHASELSSNGTGIMHNTSGMIDDAFDALKDSFGSFFGK